MKTRYIIAAASALLLLAGCSMEKDTFVPKSSQLRAVIEPETRVSFDAAGKFTWDEGDKIAVYVGSAFEEVTVEHETGNFRIQGTGDRSFYAVYPVSAAPASNSALTVTLPATYDISSSTDEDFSPVPMVAENLQGQDELYFRHVGGLVRIIVKDFDSAVSTAVVSFDKDVTGTYTVNTTNPANPTITTAGNASNNTVTFTVGGKKSFVLNVPVPCGTYTNISLKLDNTPARKLNESDLTFARHHGKTLMIGEFTFTYHVEGLHDVIAEYLGGTKEFAQAFSSYKTDGADKVGVPFVFEFSETGEDGTWAEDGNPDWISVPTDVDYTGSTTGEPLSLILTAQQNTAVDHHANELKSRVGRHPADFDLSTFNVATGETVARTTANCYVVDAPGTYKFPLVYGNGLKDGAPNEDAWHARKGIGGEYRTENYEAGTHHEVDPDPFTVSRGLLAYMVDHNDDPITSPYIPVQLGHNTFDAVVMWRDTGSGAAGNIITNVAVSGEDDNAYVSFEVPVETIQQANVTIALRDTRVSGKPVVVWSWHIWVTDADLTALDGPNGYKFAPQNIGWRDTREISRYDERSWYVRVKQTEDDGVASDAYKVTSLAGNITIDYGGRSTTYQMGRKDPRAGTYWQTKGTSSPVALSNTLYTLNGNGQTGNSSQTALQEYKDYVNYLKNEVYPIHVPNDPNDPEAGETVYAYPSNVNWVGPLTVGLSIRNPRASFSATRVHQWLNRAWHNLWDSADNYTGTGGNYSNAESIKTIYDPSPVGYKVPTWKAFEGFDDSNMPYAVVDRVEGRKYGENLFFPFIAQTGMKDKVGRYATSRFGGTVSRTLFDIYPDYVYGRTSEAWNGHYVVRPVTE